MADVETLSHQEPRLQPRFGQGPPFRIGVEEELFLVDPATLALVPRTDHVLRRLAGWGDDGVTGEIDDGIIELRTAASDTAGEVRARLLELRRRVVGGGLTIIGAGVHPVHEFGTVRHRETPHYQAVSRSTRSLLRQSPFCGVHVHVSMPDADTAIAAFNGMRKWVPLLQALSANSPFWHGQDSGLASCRSILAQSIPRSGLPRAFSGWDDYHDTMQTLCRVGELDSPGSLWWDMRPHPLLGTLELRALDAQSSLEDLAALAALAHCLIRHEATAAERVDPPPEILAEASFRAIRDGIDATYSLGGPMRSVLEITHEALDLATPHAEELGCADELTGVERLVIDGNGAVRQRRAWGLGGLPAVLRRLADETRPLAAAPTVTAAA